MDELDDDNEYDHEALNRCLGLPWEQTNPPTVSGTSCSQLRPTCAAASRIIYLRGRIFLLLAQNNVGSGSEMML